MELEDLYELNKEEHKKIISIDNIKNVYITLGRPMVRVVIKKSNAYLVFENLKNVQFIIHDIKNSEQLSFFENCEIINLNLHDKNFINFIATECWQGKGFMEKLYRSFQIIIAITAFNTLLIFFSTERNINTFCSYLITAVSFFVAIFSVFTVNQTHFHKARISLFKSGKATYYFSVDRNLTISGFLAVFLALGALLVTKDTGVDFFTIKHLNFDIHKFISRKFLLLALINASYVLTFITIRSLTEFYVKRPAEYKIGELKDEYLKA